MPWTDEQKIQYRKAYYLRHKAEIKAKVLAWQKANPDKVNAKSSKWKLNHPAKVEAIWHKYYEQNKQVLREKKQLYFVENKDKVLCRNKHWRETHVEACTALAQDYHKQHSHEIKIKSREYRQTHKPKRAAQEAKRRTTKLQATPPWLTAQHLADIEKFYVEAARLQAIDGIKRHVDHVYPLQGKAVCGLHVPWNLQVLTATENCKKHNKVGVH